MAEKKSDIPGFYRDPKTGKYYREGHEDTNPSLKKLKKLREFQYPKHPTINPPQITNVLQYLRSTELGLRAGLSAKSDYCKMKAYKKSLIEELNLNDYQEYNVVSVDFIKGTGNSVLGVWNINENRMFRCLIGERTFKGLTDQPTLGFKPSAHLAIDLCEGPDCTIICLFRHSRTESCCYGFLPQDGVSIDIYTSRWSIPLFCCASTQQGSTYGFGCEGFLRYYNRFDEGETISVKGTVHSLAFNESGNTVISGIHNGFMNLHDVRAKSLSMEIPISSYCITDLRFLNDNLVIAAGVGNMLKKIDLRMKNTVLDYFGHNCCSLKKRTFSISNDMLCVSGTDKITRIWHLNGSNPIYEMKPIIDPDNDTGVWLFTDCNKTFIYEFEQYFQRRYRII